MVLIFLKLRNASGTSLLKTSQDGPLVSGAGTSRPQLTQVIKKPQGMSIIKKSPATRYLYKYCNHCLHDALYYNQVIKSRISLFSH